MSETHNTTQHASAADRVVHAEVKVCTDHSTPDGCSLSPAACEMAREFCKNVAMGADAYLHMLPRVGDSGIQTDMTAAICYYEILSGKIKALMQKEHLEPTDGNMVEKMAARAGIAMNTMMDKTDSHIAEMLIEGCTMSITTATKLLNHYKDKPDCAELCALCREWAEFEKSHIEKLKKYL